MCKTGSVEETYFCKRAPRAHLSQISSPSDTPYPSLTLVIKMSALSEHSPAKRNKPDISGWQTPFPAQPELVAESGWDCQQNVCGGSLALKLRRNRGLHEASVQGSHNLPAHLFLPPSVEGQPAQLDQNAHIFRIFLDWVCFFGFGTEHYYRGT